MAPMPGNPRSVKVAGKNLLFPGQKILVVSLAEWLLQHFRPANGEAVEFGLSVRIDFGSSPRLNYRC
jgi:hypothetical protein